MANDGDRDVDGSASGVANPFPLLPAAAVERDTESNRLLQSLLLHNSFLEDEEDSVAGVESTNGDADLATSLRDMRRLGALADLNQQAYAVLLNGQLYEYSEAGATRPSTVGNATASTDLLGTLSLLQAAVGAGRPGTASHSVVGMLEAVTQQERPSTTSSIGALEAALASGSGGGGRLGSHGTSFLPSTSPSLVGSGLFESTVPVTTVSLPTVASDSFWSTGHTIQDLQGHASVAEDGASFVGGATTSSVSTTGSVMGGDGTRTFRMHGMLRRLLAEGPGMSPVDENMSGYTFHSSGSGDIWQTSRTVVGETPPASSRNNAAAGPAVGDGTATTSIGGSVGATAANTGDGARAEGAGQRLAPGHRLTSQLPLPAADVNLNVQLHQMLRRLIASEEFQSDLERTAQRMLVLGSAASGQRLSPEEIDALPKVRFDGPENQMCAVCLEAYRDGELLTELRCGHCFHVECLAGWLRRSAQCPLCRAVQGSEAQQVQSS
eukprot:TRINITY_DN13962_c0_g2_i1.p1 TRINITY_DN13962_c0_g2~~TRINITY_DN13962_c0_g2_i1.p1  ORF type:complete len:495 (+),score=89.42 TRINITY_DN13962_c0_g2_i1:81-1565(+)